MPCLSFAQTLLSCPDVAEIRVNYRHNIVALNVTIRECLKMLVAISVLQCIPLIAKEPEDHRTSTGYCMASTETQRRRPCCLAFCSQCLCCWPPGRAARTPCSSETLFPQNMRRCSVCERHFRESDILTSSKYVDSKTGKVVEAKLKIARLSSDAVPSVFPNCPAYLSAPAATSREAPAEKRMRLEAASLREAIANSLETHEEEETKHKFDTFQALLECLPQMKLSNFWSVISRPACIHFLNLALEDAPRVLLSITVLEDLTVKVHCQDVQLTTIDGIGAIPHKVNDIRCLTRLLDSVESLHGELSSVMIPLRPSSSYDSRHVNLWETEMYFIIHPAMLGLVLLLASAIIWNSGMALAPWRVTATQGSSTASLAVGVAANGEEKRSHFPPFECRFTFNNSEDTSDSGDSVRASWSPIGHQATGGSGPRKVELVPKRSGTFALCVTVGDQGDPDPRTFAEFLAFCDVLGASRYVFYVRSLGTGLDYLSALQRK
ncbi:hypothetical protein MRX96_025798 [Rhipicephalus microplus]